MAYIGGIDVRLMDLEDPRPLEREIREKVTAAKEGDGYVHHSVPNTMSLAQYQRVIELIRRYGEY